MNKKKTFRNTCFFIIVSVLLVVLMIYSLMTGSASLSVGDVLKALSSHDTTSKLGVIVWNIRLPRILSAVILGGALSVSGFLLQTFFANPIAGPFILGISSGAKLVVALIMILFLDNGILMSSATMIVAAFVGSMIAMGMVLLVSKKLKSMSILVVCGIMIGYICSAITELLVAFANDSNIVNLHNWSMGSFSGITWSNISVMSVVVFVGFIAAFLISKPMSAYQMGENYAASVGVNVKVFRVLLILLSSVLSATVTAFAGPISFVGIAVPHLVKTIMKTARPVVVIPASFLGGAVFCLFCDLIARNLFAPTELSISSITAIFGAPVVVAMLIKRHSAKRG